MYYRVVHIFTMYKTLQYACQRATESCGAGTRNHQPYRYHIERTQP